MKFHNNNDFITLFEKRLSEYTGAPYVVLTDSCTSAIFLSMKIKNIKKTKIPKNTYISVPQTLYHCGISFTYNNNKWEKYYKFSGTNIYDYAVHFKKGMYKKDTIQCLSFHQKKRLNIGKGGAILLDNYNDYLILKRMVHDGRDSSISVKDDKNIIIGYHMNMTPDDAAKGVLILNQIQEYKKYTYKDYPDISKLRLF